MSELGENFQKKFGKPHPAVPCGTAFKGHNLAFFWDELQQEIGAGWFLDRFVYLFGVGLEEFQSCLKAWHFLLPDDKECMIVGKNAYGALLVAEEPSKHALSSPIGILNPLDVSYQTNPNLIFSNLIGYYLPEKQLPQFLDSGLYDAWRKTLKDELELHEILAIKVPLTLDGKMEASNFQPENMIEYYKTTADIYKNNIPIRR